MEFRPGDREFGSWLDKAFQELQPGLLALDLGCGLGDDARFMAQAGLTVIGIDRSVERVAQAAMRAPDASFVVADLAHGLPFRAELAGLVTASLSLHYFGRQTTDAIVAEIARVLKPEATLLCRVNVVGERFALWGVGIEHEPDYFEVAPGKFKRFFTEGSLRAILEPQLTVEAIWMEETRVLDEHYKKTLVARARRRA